MNKKIISISPDPVINAVVELRFESVHPKNAVYGLLYNELKGNFKQQFSLPIMQLPEEARLQAPNLKFKPWYQLSGKNILLQVGPDVIAINCDCSSGYIGWGRFYSLIEEINTSVIHSGVVKTITRVGIRFISFFENINIFDKTKLKIQYKEGDLTKNLTTFTTHIKEQNFIHRLVLNNEVAQQLPNASKKQGSIVDIDTFTDERMTDFDDLGRLINQGHELEKTLFFSLLEEPFLKSLNPSYEEEVKQCKH